MKKFLLLFTLLSFQWQLQAQQSYDPIEYGYKKSFIKTPGQDTIYSFAIEQKTGIGSDTLYRQFNCSTLFSEVWGPSFVPDTCMTWGNSCQRNTGKSIFGRYMYKSSLGNYIFYNKDSATINIDFGLSPGDSALMFSDASNIFYLEHTGIIYDTILGMSDSMKVFEIHHYDNLMNAVITSPLHNYEILLGKNSGLVSFIEILRFPYQLNGLRMIGSTRMNAGFTRIRATQNHNLQIGDEWQTKQYSIIAGPPFASDVFYQKHVVINRTSIAGGVSYTYHRERFYGSGSGGLVIDTVYATLMDSVSTLALPFERASNNLTGPLHYGNICGQNYLNYTTQTGGGWYYCDLEDAYCNYDAFPMVTTTDEEIMVGLGMYSHIDDNQYIATMYPNYIVYTLTNYSNINGISCGNEQFIGVEEISANALLKIFPNPATDNITIAIHGDATGLRAQLADVSGKLCGEYKLAGVQTQLDISNLTPGMYFVNVFTGNNEMYSSMKVIKK